MLKRLLQPVVGVATTILIVINLIFWCTPFYVLALIKLLPIARLQRACFRGLEALASMWMDGNRLIAAMHGVHYDVRGTDQLVYEQWYLVGTNHVSWVDVIALQYAFNHKIPFLRFFLKRALIYVPLLGFAWWALELPFMKRHTRAQIDANPALRQADIETTRKSCAPFRERPTAIINFLEGTRYTQAKHRAQESPYKNLLRPKVGGIAYAIDAIGDVMQIYLDVTLVYPVGHTTIWDLVCGRIKRVIVDVQTLRIPDELMHGDYGGDPQYREKFKHWVEAVWRAKDERIDELRKEF